jgi:flagellin
MLRQPKWLAAKMRRKSPRPEWKGKPMSNVSVNTNYGAMIALQNLNMTNTELSKTQNRISTGLKVGTAKDNAAVFAIAQNQRAQVASLGAVSQSLQRGQSSVDVALSAGGSISDVLTQMKEKALSAADTSISTASRNALQDEFQSLRDQITKIVDNASFDGMNLISSTAIPLESLANTQGGKITVAAQDLSLTGIGLSAAATFTSSTTASTLSTLIDAAIEDVSSKLGKLGTGSKALTRHNDFVNKLSDSLTDGIGMLVDADLAKESATLQALQTKQQLGVQSLSIANQAPQVILSLFR